MAPTDQPQACDIGYGCCQVSARYSPHRPEHDRILPPNISVNAVAILVHALSFGRTLPHLRRHVLVYFDDEVCVEQRVLVHSVFGITTRIAHHARSFLKIVEAVVGMPVYP